MNHPLQCQCGTLKGYVSPPDMAIRGVCYCKDCQAFAHFLERPGNGAVLKSWVEPNWLPRSPSMFTLRRG